MEQNYSLFYMHRWQEIRENPALRAKLEAAQKVRELIRTWFRSEGFLEVETPTLVRAPGQEPHLDPFETVVQNERHERRPAFLTTSPEYALKKLLVAGFPKIFELARCYRNGEPRGNLHNPEFTMLEWYRAGTDYRGIMNDAEQLVYFVVNELFANRRSQIADHTISDKRLAISFFAPPWERLSVRESFRKYAAIDLDAELGRADFDTWFFKIFLTHIEPKLGQNKPTILYDYPASMAALARLKADDPCYAERFEVYLRGVELANAFSELGDAAEQRQRFLDEQAVRTRAGKLAHPIDEDFLAALQAGLPECGGIALGVDRLAMILLDAQSIDEVVFFPYS